MKRNRYANWMAEIKKIHPVNHARLQADYQNWRKHRGFSAHDERLKRLDAIAEQHQQKEQREKVDNIHGAPVAGKATPKMPETDAFRVQKQNRDEPEFPISGEDHKTQRPSLDVTNPKPESPFQAERRKYKARFEPLGYVWVGSKTHSIFSGLPAEHVDHCPALDYVNKRVPKYPETAPRFLVAATAMENLTKAHYGSACLCEASAKIYHHLTTLKKYVGSHMAAYNAHCIQVKWSTSSECPCVLCAASEPLSRWLQCQQTAHVKEKMPRR